MGSPFNIADVELAGGYVPPIDGVSFQDKGAISPDGYTVYLVEWKTVPGNRPGFCVWKVSDKEKSFSKSGIIEGCCDSIELADDGVVLSIYRKNQMENVTVSDFN
jgi:hypothetical protein